MAENDIFIINKNITPNNNPNDVMKLGVYVNFTADVKSVNSKTGQPMSNKILQELLYNYGPIYVTIDTSLLKFYPNNNPNDSYPFEMTTIGVLSSKLAINTPTHAVLLIGYGTLPNNKKYWILKNSWSNTWGYKGFFAVEWVTSPIGVKNNVGQLKSGPTALFDDITYISTENLKKILLNVEIMEKFGDNPNEHEIDLQLP